MRRLLLLFLVLSPSLFGYASYSGWCEQGGQRLTVAGQLSVGYLQQSYPNFTQSGAGPGVTVYATGTTNKVTLYSDAAGTSLANPFPCSKTGQYQFFSTSTVVDILFSGTGISSFTRGGIGLQEPLNFVSDENGLSIAVNCAQAVTRGAVLMLSKQKWDLNGTCAADIQAFSGGGFAPASGHTTTLSGAFGGDLTYHIDQTAGGSVLFTGPVTAFPPEWFGAAGVGAGTCDTVPLQATIDAAISRTVILSQNYGVCSPGVFTYPANAGITIDASIATPSVPGSTPQGGLIATTVSPATSLLTVYAYNTVLRNLYLDGNSKAATHGLVAAGAGMSIGGWTNVTIHQFSGAGVYVTPASGNTTTVLTGGTIGTSTFTVSSSTTNRNTYNTFYCGSVVFSPGTANAEFHTVSGSGTSWTINSTFTFDQNGQPVGCNGNNNELKFHNLDANNNGTYGFHLVAQTDANGILMDNPFMTQNTLGDEFWEGAGVGLHNGGNFAGSGGPPITLGTTALTSGPAFMTVQPLQDLEEASPSVTVTTSGTTVTGTGFVTGDRWRGLTATINSVRYQISSVTNSTTLVLTTSAGTQGPLTMEVDYNVVKVVCSNSVQLNLILDIQAVFVSPSGSCGAGGSGSARGTAIFGVGNGAWTKTPTEETYIYNGSIYYTPVGAGTGVTSLLGACLITAETGGDNAIVASCPSGAYQGTSFPTGFRVTFLNSTYALRSGSPGNTLNINGSGVKTIGSCLSPGGFAVDALIAGWTGDVIWIGTGNWCVMGAE